jgi:3-dehydroquinate synthase
MPTFLVRTPHQSYENVVERGVIGRASEYIPREAGKVFLVTTQDVWQLHGEKLTHQFDSGRLHVLFFVGGEANKRLASVETLADWMLALGADRKSIIVGFGGGIVTDMSGFLAAIFMRGVPVLQIPTTLLAQVDAATGGKTGVNLAGGKNLIGSFHQPIAVLIDPEVLSTLPLREYRAGLFEIVKCGIIRDPDLFELLHQRTDDVLSGVPNVLDGMIQAAVRIKAEVVSADEREGDLRRILNFGHTIGHAIEAETEYVRFLHGEAVAWGMLAVTRLAVLLDLIQSADAEQIRSTICRYGPLPSAKDLVPERLLARLASDKKTMKGKVHFVLPTSIGQVTIRSDVPHELVLQAMTETLQ